MLPPPPTPTLFPYTTLFRSNTPWTANNTTFSDSYIATCNSDGSALTITTPFTGGIGFKISQIGSGVDSSYFPVGADLKSANRSEEHTSELQSRGHLVCRLLL